MKPYVFAGLLAACLLTGDATVSAAFDPARASVLISEFNNCSPNVDGHVIP